MYKHKKRLYLSQLQKKLPTQRNWDTHKEDKVMEISEFSTFPASAYSDVEAISKKLFDAFINEGHVSPVLRAGFYSYYVGKGYYGYHDLSINGNIFASLDTKTGTIHTEEPISVTPLHVELYKLLKEGRTVVIKLISHTCA
jgi:hypothetical protein